MNDFLLSIKLAEGVLLSTASVFLAICSSAYLHCCAVQCWTLEVQSVFALGHCLSAIYYVVCSCPSVHPSICAVGFGTFSPKLFGLSSSNFIHITYGRHRTLLTFRCPFQISRSLKSKRSPCSCLLAQS